MFTRRTLKILAIPIGIYALLWIPAAFSSRYLDSAFGLIAAIPVVSTYLFNMFGIPGLLVNGGACGWGWCAPTPIRWVFVVVFWLLLAWLVAWTIAASTRKAAP